MKADFYLCFTLLAGLCPQPFSQATAVALQETETETVANRMPFIGGMGGAYFLAEPGKLVVELEKRDLNRSGLHTELRAWLLGPDREVLDEAVIADDGGGKGDGLGPVGRCRLSAPVDAKGVYALQIAVSRDRYGEHVVWRFDTNCEKYIIATARGHKDEPHQEPIVLNDPKQAAQLCFLPRRGSFEIEVTGLPSGSEPLILTDANGKTIAQLAPDTKGNLSRGFSAPDHEAVPWRLRFARAAATVHIDGVTRWEGEDLQKDWACWSPGVESWFDLLGNRWLLTPYHRTVYTPSGEEGEVNFRIHNSAATQKTVRLEWEFPETPWPVSLSNRQLSVAPGSSAAVVARFKGPPMG